MIQGQDALLDWLRSGIAIDITTLDSMKKEFAEADVDWKMIYYSEAVHSFTQPMAGNDNSRGAAYQERADKRSWQAMNNFFDEIFQPAAK